MLKIPFWSLAVLLVGCSGDKTTTDTGSTVDGSDADTDADADADTDADTDADSDADADTDSDTDTDTYTTPTTTTPPFGCYALYAADESIVGSLSVDKGFDGYDSVVTDRLLHEERDLGSDGFVDTVNDYVFDTYGRLVHQELSQYGYAPYAEDFTYDTAGNLLTDSVDLYVDGSVDSVEAFTYDANNNVLTDTFDDGGDGTIDYSITYTYDAYDNVLTAAEDEDGDTVVDTNYAYTVDGEGRITSLVGTDAADGVTVVFSETVTYTDPYTDSYVDDTDFDGDGTVDDQVVVLLDVNGLLLSYTDDSTPGDGAVELTQLVTWDYTNQLPLTVTVTLPDYGAYGLLIQNQNLFYDAQNRLVASDLTVDLPDIGYLGVIVINEDWTFGGSCP